MFRVFLLLRNATTELWGSVVGDPPLLRADGATDGTFAELTIMFLHPFCSRSYINPWGEEKAKKAKKAKTKPTQKHQKKKKKKTPEKQKEKIKQQFLKRFLKRERKKRMGPQQTARKPALPHARLCPWNPPDRCSPCVRCGGGRSPLRPPQPSPPHPTLAVPFPAAKRPRAQRSARSPR